MQYSSSVLIWECFLALLKSERTRCILLHFVEFITLCFLSIKNTHNKKTTRFKSLVVLALQFLLLVIDLSIY